MLCPDGRFLSLSYADAEETRDRAITRYPVLPDGSLGAPQDVAKTGPANYGITMSPDGGLLYVTSNVAQDVEGFRVGKDGSLKPVPGLPPTVRDAVGLRVTPDGRHLYVCANFDDTEPPGSGLLGFTIHPDGTLKLALGSPFLTGGQHPLSQSLAIRPGPTTTTR